MKRLTFEHQGLVYSFDVPDAAEPSEYVLRVDPEGQVSVQLEYLVPFATGDVETEAATVHLSMPPTSVEFLPPPEPEAAEPPPVPDQVDVVTPSGAVWLAVADALQSAGWDGAPEDWIGSFHSRDGVPYGTLRVVVQPLTGRMGEGKLAALTPDVLLGAIRLSARAVTSRPPRHLRLVTPDEVLDDPEAQEKPYQRYRVPFDWEKEPE